MTMRRIAMPAAMLAVLAAGGCATATIEEAVPAGALQHEQALQGQDQGQAAQEQGAVFSRPGEFPNLNVIPTPAAPQLTDGERAAQAAALRARRDQVTGAAASRGVADRSTELRRLATTHTDTVLREIESE